MNAFMSSTRLALTPLAPIHIGTGEDFEPTNYVIEDKLLYAFDPSRVELPGELRRRLLEAVDCNNDGGIRKIYKMFYEHRALFIPVAHSVIPVSPGVAEKYLAGLERWDNRNFIERAVCAHRDGRPYLPGSSVKGAMRTAWLEELYKNHHQGKPREMFIIPGRNGMKNDQLESLLLGGDFGTSPLRLLKMADFMPQQDNIDHRIIFACNYKKNDVISAKGPSTRKEVILSGQYRAFIADLTLLEPGQKNIPQARSPQRPALKDLARYCNDFYQNRFDAEARILRERGFVDADWLARLHALLDSVKEQRERSEVFLLRLGRYNDAETKTLRGLASIKINQRQGTPALYQGKTTTLWLAAEQDKQQSRLLPFGWALLEIDPQGENAALRSWCEKERQGRPDMGVLRKRAEENKARLLAERSVLEEARAEQSRKEREQAAQAERMERERADMSAEQRLVADFCKELEEHPALKPQDAGAHILAKCVTFLESAVTWSEAERKQCVEKIEPWLKAKNMFMGKKGKVIKEYLQKLRGAQA